LPPELQRHAATDSKGNVERTPSLIDALLDVFLRSISILRSRKKLGALLLQLSPAFSPRKHQLNELDELVRPLGGYRVAVEFRNRNWLVGEQLNTTLEFMRNRKLAFVNVDAPAEEHFTVIPPDLNEITNGALAYL